MNKTGKSISSSKENLQGCLKFSSLIVIFLTIGLTFFVFAIWIMNRLGIRFLWGPVIVLIFYIASHAAASLNAKIFHDRPPKQIFSNWQDRIAALLAMIMFFTILALPGTMGTDALYAHLIALSAATAVSISTAYLFGSENLKKSIRDFPRALKTIRRHKD